MRQPKSFSLFPAVLAVLSLLCMARPAGAASQSPEVVIDLQNVTKRVLDNGMTVLVKEDHAAPVATVNVWVKTGYFNETDQWTGISHLLEHMFFKGTPTRPVGRIQDEVKSSGGYWNAGTIYDHTSYYIVLPSSEINHALDIEADALINSNFPQEELDKEHEVVIQEILRKYDTPGAMVWERMMDLAFTEHYIRRWRMGSPEQVRAMDRDVLVGYYTDRYRPENIVLVIVGDVDTDAVLAEAGRLFGAMARGELKHHASPPEPPQTEFRYRQDTGDITQTYIAMGFHAPSALDDDEHAVEVLANILGAGKSSRLFRALKERAGLVNTVSAGYYSLPGVGVLYVEAELDEQDPGAARNAVFVEIERLKAAPPAQAELDKIKTRIEYDFLSAMEDVSGQASNLAYFEALGDFNLLNEYVSRLRAVTAEDVQRAAQKYLNIENCSIQEIRPEADKDDTDTARAESAIHNAVAEADIHVAEDGAPLVVQKLSSGATVVIKQRTRLPLVSAGVYFPGGRIWETPDTAGLTRLMLRASLKGTATRSAEQIQDEIAALGASVGATAQNDYSSWAFSVLNRNFAPLLDLIADVILNPAFPEAEIEKERDSQLAQLVREQDSMFSYPLNLARRAIYGDHPYGLSADGLEEAVTALTREQIVQRHRELVRGGGALIVVVGDVDPDAVVKLLESKLAALPADSAPPAAAPAPDYSVGETVVERNKSQTAQAFAFPAVGADSEDLPALGILRNIASGMGGRLYDEVREKHNLAYTVVAYLDTNSDGGILINYAATSPENEQKARDLMIAEWSKMAAGDVTQEEFENAKKYTLGIFQIGLQSNGDLRSQYARDFFTGRGLDFVDRYPDMLRAVTIEDVKNAAARYAAPDGMALGVVRATPDAGPSAFPLE